MERTYIDSKLNNAGSILSNDSGIPWDLSRHSMQFLFLRATNGEYDINISSLLNQIFGMNVDTSVSDSLSDAIM